MKIERDLVDYMDMDMDMDMVYRGYKKVYMSFLNNSSIWYTICKDCKTPY